MQVPEIRELYDGFVNGKVASAEESKILLRYFVQQNFLGPFDDSLQEPTGILLEQLKSDNEVPSQAVKAAWALIAAIKGLETSNERLWIARASLIHQRILVNASGTLSETIFENYKAHVCEHGTSSDLEVEIAGAYLFHRMIEEGSRHLSSAESMAGLVFALSGASGKKTKFQVNSTHQLVCYATSDKISSGNNDSHEPNRVAIESDLLLETPLFDRVTVTDLEEPLRSIDPSNQPQLSPGEYAALLLEAELQRISHISIDQFAGELRGAIYDRIVDGNGRCRTWHLATEALWHRSLLELDNRRLAERAILQLQSLNDEFWAPSFDQAAKPESRLDCLDQIFLYLPEPFWDRELALAKSYLGLGMIKSAITGYERLHLIPDLALLMAAIGESEQALRSLDEYLKDHDQDARGWAIRGDISQNESDWLKAWEIGKYPAAMRSLGRYLYNPIKGSGKEKDLSRSVECFELSLQSNRLNSEAWFYSGCIYLELFDPRKAATAFTQYVALEPTDAKGWSNLARASADMHKNAEALHALQQALRCGVNAEPDWRIWSNYIVLASECKEWDMVMEGIRRIIKIMPNQQDKYIDVGVLLEMTDAFIGQPFEASPQQQSFITLVSEEIPKVITSESRLYSLISRVETWRGRNDLALSQMEKAFRLALSQFEETETLPNWKVCTKLCRDLVELYRRVGDLPGRFEGSKICSNWKFKAKTAVRSSLNKGGMQFEDTPEYASLEQLKSAL